MKQTLFFYDLETSGLNPRHQRVMQFAGQRTDLQCQPIGNPVDILIQLTEDILPEPQAIVITGTTPQKTREEGISEPEFARFLIEKVFTPGTIAVGFNNVRFDDEFVRHTLWRNFFDPYEWAWSDKRSRWDLLDVVRMTRALRPEGIKWPVNENGDPINKLEKLSIENGLEHLHAHDALSDVEATIQVANLIRTRQPKLFEYLFTLRNKKEVEKLVNLENPIPFVYSSGKYSKSTLFTTIAFPIAPGRRPGTVLVYDLQYDPKKYLSFSRDDIKNALYAKKEERQKEGFLPIPVKELAYNKCPAVAPLGVVDVKSWERLQLSYEEVEKRITALSQDFVDKVTAVLAEREPFKASEDVEGQLYEGFIDNSDKIKIEAVRAASESDLADFHPMFNDERLTELLFRYKARHFPRSLSEDEHAKWEGYKSHKIASQAPQFMKALQKISQDIHDEETQFIVEELKLWYESIAPSEE